MNQKEIIQAIDGFSDHKILVIGDVILDAYFIGSVTRISPEAPVSILDISKKEYRLGGAANVALNIRGLGATPILCSIIGNDSTGKTVLELMQSQGLSLDGIQTSENRTTSLKTRLISSHHQLMRMDEEQTDLISEDDSNMLLKGISQIIETHNPSAIIFEDYDKGVLSPKLISSVMIMAKSKNIPTAVDPKKRNFLSYAGATLFKPNLRELRDGLNLPQLRPVPEDLNKAFASLKQIMPIENAFFTLSSQGVFITNGYEHHAIEAKIRNIADVSGAGDTVISVATCALASGLNLEQIAYVSNLAGGWVCQFPGVVSIEAEELKKELNKISVAL
jgi:D-glycero-beta-D-manno-heptose-7-phosphate kinase